MLPSRLRGRSRVPHVGGGSTRSSRLLPFKSSTRNIRASVSRAPCTRRSRAAASRCRSASARHSARRLTWYTRQILPVGLTRYLATSRKSARVAVVSCRARSRPALGLILPVPGLRYGGLATTRSKEETGKRFRRERMSAAMISTRSARPFSWTLRCASPAISSWSSTPTTRSAVASPGQHQGDDPAAGAEVDHPLPLPDPGKIAQEQRIEGKAVTVARLDDAQVIAAQFVDGFFVH